MNSFDKKAEVVGYKSRTAVFPYCFIAAAIILFNIVFCVFFFNLLINNGKGWLIVGVILMVTLACCCIFALILVWLALICPKELMAVTQSKLILLGKNKTVLFEDITYVSCREAKISRKNRSTDHSRYGEIRIVTKSGEKYVQKYLSEVQLLFSKIESLRVSAEKEADVRDKKIAEEENQVDLSVFRQMTDESNTLQKYKGKVSLRKDEHILMHITPQKNACVRHSWFALGDFGAFGNTPMCLFLFGFCGIFFLLSDIATNFAMDGVFFGSGIVLMAVCCPIAIVWAIIKSARFQRYRYLITTHEVLKIITPKFFTNASGQKVKNAGDEFGGEDIVSYSSFSGFSHAEIYQNWFAKVSGTYCVKLQGTNRIFIGYITKKEAEQIVRINNIRDKDRSMPSEKSHKEICEEEIGIDDVSLEEKKIAGELSKDLTGEIIGYDRLIFEKTHKKYLISGICMFFIGAIAVPLILIFALWPVNPNIMNEIVPFASLCALGGLLIVIGGGISVKGLIMLIKHNRTVSFIKASFVTDAIWFFYDGARYSGVKGGRLGSKCVYKDENKNIKFCNSVSFKKGSVPSVGKPEKGFAVYNAKGESVFMNGKIKMVINENKQQEVSKLRLNEKIEVEEVPNNNPQAIGLLLFGLVISVPLIYLLLLSYQQKIPVPFSVGIIFFGLFACLTLFVAGVGVWQLLTFLFFKLSLRKAANEGMIATGTVDKIHVHTETGYAAAGRRREGRRAAAWTLYNQKITYSFIDGGCKFRRKSLKVRKLKSKLSEGQEISVLVHKRKSFILSGYDTSLTGKGRRG